MEDSNRGIIELAKLLKERNNKDSLGWQIGVVVEPLPDIKVTILDQKVILGREKLIWTSSIFDLHRLLKPLEEEHKALKVGDKIALLPTKEEDRFLVIDKVVEK